MVRFVANIKFSFFRIEEILSKIYFLDSINVSLNILDLNPSICSSL